MIDAPTTLLGPDGLPLSIVERAVPPDRRRRVPVMPGRDWWTIRTRHHTSALLLPAGGDPELDRYYLAAHAREYLDLEWRHRANDLRKRRRGK